MLQNEPQINRGWIFKGAFHNYSAKMLIHSHPGCSWYNYFNVVFFLPLKQKKSDINKLWSTHYQESVLIIFPIMRPL